MLIFLKDSRISKFLKSVGNFFKWNLENLRLYTDEMIVSIAS